MANLLKIDKSLILRNQMRQEQLLAQKNELEEKTEQEAFNKNSINIAVLTEKITNLSEQFNKENDKIQSSINDLNLKIKSIEDENLKLQTNLVKSNTYNETLNQKRLEDKDLLGQANSEVVKYKTLYEAEKQAKLTIEIQLDEEKANRLTQKLEPQIITQMVPIKQEPSKQTGWNVETKRDGVGNILRYVLTPEDK